MAENYERIAEIALNDVDVLKEKGAAYGDSWKKRGGIGAFMMLARKWDRIENQAAAVGYDIFAAGIIGGEEGIMDDIADLRCYLLLVESEIRGMLDVPPAPSPAGAPIKLY